jgi:SAM-dependent methyltransferase
MPDDAGLRIAAGYWREKHLGFRDHAHDDFMSHPILMAWIAIRGVGTNETFAGIVEKSLRKHVRPGGRVLSVGCGPGEKEMEIAAKNPDYFFEALDIEPDVIGRNRVLARERGIPNLSFAIGDMNRLELPPSSYGAVLGLGAIHHVEDLEGFYDSVRRALVPEGVLLALEYVGPTRFQWSDRQIEEANRVLARLPGRLKPGRSVAKRHEVRYMLLEDPSEAVRSAEILPLLPERGFRVDTCLGLGGSLLQPVLSYNINAFAKDRLDDMAWLRWIFDEESRLIAEGVLGDDFAAFVAKPV